MNPLGERKVFCLGLSRTGTTALAEKLKSLGLRTIHYSLNAFIRNGDFCGSPLQVAPPRPGRYWEWAFNRELRSQDKVSFQELLDNYDAFADLPYPLFYREFAKAYPNALFILTTRDEQSWLKSMQWLLDDGHVLWKHGLLDDSLLMATYNTCQYDADKLVQAFHSHNNAVRSFFSHSSQFLELKLDCGDFEGPKLETFLGYDSGSTSGIPKRNQQRSVTQAMRLRHQLTRSCTGMHFASAAYSYVERLFRGS